MVDPVSISVSLLAAQTVSYVKSKGKKVMFLADAIENAGERLEDRYEGLDVDVLDSVASTARPGARTRRSADRFLLSHIDDK